MARCLIRRVSLITERAQHTNRGYLENTKVGDVFVGGIFLLLLIENVLQVKVWQPFAYIDEACTLLFAFGAIYKRFIKRSDSSFSKEDSLIVVGCICLVLFGLAGNIFNKFQNVIGAITIDAFTCLKFFIAYLALKELGLTTSVFSICRTIGKAFIAVMFVLLVAEEAIGIGMTTETRFGIKAFVFLFGHPSNFAAAIVGILALLLVDRDKSWLSITLCMILLVFTTRFKAIAFVGVMLLVLLVFKKTDRISFTLMAGGATVAIVLAWEQIATYFFSDNETARAVLLDRSIDIANWLFPLGSGFGTYGCEVSKTAYTSLYYIFGINLVYGLTPADPAYLADMFWPTVIAQFGWIGFGTFLLALVSFAKSAADCARASGNFFWACMSILVYFAITSTSEPAFFSSYAVYLAMCLVLCNVPKDGLSRSSSE